MSLYSESLSDNSFYLFAVYDGRIERFRLADKMRLGRMTKDNVPEIAIQNMFLSRSHGYFSIENGSVSYTAEETTNGIYLNGTVLPAGETVVLSDGDELVIPTDRTSGNKNSIMLKCAFSPRNISMWSTMTEAQLDELTGLPGRRLFSEHFRALQNNSTDDKLLFILDIDKFKQINDTYGHSAGDEALKLLSAELLMPEYGISFPARWGGDEFVGFISGSKDEVIGSLNALNASLYSKPINKVIRVVISVGLCRFALTNGELSVLVENADKALYRSKRSETEKVNIFE